MPFIDKMLVLSTAHFTDDDNMRLCEFARDHAASPDTSTERQLAKCVLRSSQPRQREMPFVTNAS